MKPVGLNLALNGCDESRESFREVTMRSTVPLFLATAILMASAVVPGSAMSLGGGVHISPGMNAPRIPPPSTVASVSSVPHVVSNGPASIVGTGPVPLKHKRSGKLNGACYRSCMKTSMGDAFRTDQFCAYSCSLD
jgi:hypothetical protein